MSGHRTVPCILEALTEIGTDNKIVNDINININSFIFSPFNLKLIIQTYRLMRTKIKISKQ